MTAERDQTSKLVISEDDLAQPHIDERVQALEAAATPQTVRQVGAPPAGGTSRVSSNIGALALAGLLGGILGWILSEVPTRPDSETGPLADNLGASAALFFALFALGLAAVLSAWDGLEARSPQKVGAARGRALPLAGIGGAISGYFAQVAVFEPILESAFERATSEADMLTAYHLARGFGFGLAGFVIGAALGAASGTGKRAVNGAVGGAVGGFVGGFAFDYIGQATNSGAPSRAVAFALTGVLVGLAISLVEHARKEHWLEIVSGGMAGKQFILYHDRTVVGSAPGCAVTLIKDPKIAPEHVALTQSQQGLRMTALDPSRPALVNGQPEHAGCSPTATSCRSARRWSATARRHRPCRPSPRPDEPVGRGVGRPRVAVGGGRGHRCRAAHRQRVTHCDRDGGGRPDRDRHRHRDRVGRRSGADRDRRPRRRRRGDRRRARGRDAPHDRRRHRARPRRDLDLALVAVDPEWRAAAPLPLRTEPVRPGADVYAIGHPLGDTRVSVTRGIVGSVGRDAGVAMLQTDAAINLGGSAGPLVDDAGRVAGLVVSKLAAADGIGHAVEASEVGRFLAALPLVPVATGDTGGGFPLPALPLVVIGAGAWWLLSQRRRRPADEDLVIVLGPARPTRPQEPRP